MIWHKFLRLYQVLILFSLKFNFLFLVLIFGINIVLFAGDTANFVTNIYRILDEQNIKYDKGQLQKAAVAGMLKVIDKRAKILNSNDVATIRHHCTQIEPEIFNEGIGYIKVNGIFQNADMICSFMATNSCVNGNILDLRDAGGDDYAAVADIMSCFSTNRTFLFSIEDNTGSEISDYFTISSNSFKIAVDKPLMVLVNEKTTDTSLVLATLLKGHKKVLLLGEATKTLDKIMSIIPLTEREYLYLPIETIRIPDIACEHVVVPDVIVKSGEQINKELPVSGKLLIGKDISGKAQADRVLMERVKNDIVLQRAVDLLLGIKAVDVGM